MQDIVDAVRNDSLLDCDYNCGVGGQRNRRHNHNSRQKKYSSVSSRQREGGSLPSNVNVTYCGATNFLSALDQQPVTTPAFIHEVKNSNSSSNQSSKQQQRRNKAVTSSSATVEKDLDTYPLAAAAAAAVAAGGLIVGSGDSAAAAASPLCGVSGTTTNCAAATSGDCVIEMDEPMMDIQQQQQILQSKGQDAATQV